MRNLEPLEPLLALSPLAQSIVRSRGNETQSRSPAAPSSVGGNVVIGVGIDLQEISEFHRTLERAGEPYIQRVFTVAEIAYCRAKPDSSSSFAVRFAAKEAAVKALGIAGIDGLSWHDFETTTASSGCPYMTLGGVAARHASEKRVTSLVISLTHSKSTAGAIAIAETPCSPIDQNPSLYRQAI